jgi:hypothetical protein
MKRFSIFLVLLLMFSAFSVEKSDERNWALVKKSEHIHVYKKPTSNGYNAIRIQAKVATSLESFIDFIDRVDRYPDWVYKCQKAENLLPPPNSSTRYWMVSDFPFPFKDRELTIVSDHRVDAQGIYYSSSVAETASKATNNIVITNFKSNWKVTPIAEKAIKIEYEVSTEPGGSIPAWLYNLAVDQGPFRTMQNLKGILEDGS